MRSPAIVQGSEALMQVLFKASPRQHGPDDVNNDEVTCKLPGRAFVVAHLFAAHPQLLVTSNSQLDTMVESAAVVMTQTYAQFATSFISRHASWYQKQQTSVASFKAFYSALDSWKRSDAKKLLLTMERHYLELDRLWRSVQRRTLGEGDETWRAGIQGQREDLLAKIRTLGGADAVAALMQRERELRLADNGSLSSPTLSLTPPAGHLKADSGDLSEKTTDYVADSASSLARPATSDRASETEQILLKPSVVLAKAISDPASQDVDRVLENFDLTAAAALQDAKLAHELVLDPRLRLEPAATNTLVGAVQQAVTKAFFDHIKQELASGNSDHVASILAQLRLDMRTIVPPSSQQREALDRELDPACMAAQLPKGALDVYSKFRLVLMTARSVCAPIRDDDIDLLLERLAAVDFAALADIHRAAGYSGTKTLSDAAKSSIGELLEITQGIMQLIRNVRLDALNHQLDTTVRPWLRLHAVEYEQTKMAQLLNTQHQGNAQMIAAQTTAWMRSAASREISGQCTLSRSASSPPLVKHVFLEALLDLCFAPTALSPEATPATWALDQQRIQQMQNEIQVLLSASALCALVKGLGQKTGLRIGDSELRQDAHELLDLFRADDVSMDRIITAVQRMAAGSELVVARLVPKTLAKDDPVFQAMERQLRKFMLAELDKDEEPGALARRLEADSQAVAAMLSLFSMAVVHKDVPPTCLIKWDIYN
ncbi:hypothetical protein GGF42_004305 [Coemansia sp. RSA 2424]|nr:hypothetical protein GGF42_004305 [Coemansia sp. RSA 2424]